MAASGISRISPTALQPAVRIGLKKEGARFVRTGIGPLRTG